MILRFLSFYLYFSNRLDGVEYKGRLDEFLAEVMKKINGMNEDEIQELFTLFTNTMDLLAQHHDSAIFRFHSYGENKRPINMLLFESLTYLFVECKKRNIELSQHNINHLKKEFERSGRFSRGIDSVSNITYRFRDALKHIMGENNDWKNFKSIQEANFNLCPLNIFTGTNSSGKSSIIQAILLSSSLANPNDTLQSYLDDLGSVDQLLCVDSKERIFSITSTINR